MRATLPAFASLLAGCAHELPPDQACLEIGYAIAARTEACDGDAEGAVDRLEAFESDYVCTVPELIEPAQERDLFGCSLVLRNLACELVLDYGDDLDAWLASSPVCDTLVDPA